MSRGKAGRRAVGALRSSVRPETKASGPATLPGAPGAGPPAKTQAVVAVVDDDYRILESLEALLESAGLVVRLFDAAAPLLLPGALEEIDCVISDIGMHVIDGVELKRRLQLERPELPVILITGREAAPPEPSTATPAYRDFFHKPFRSEELLAAVNTALAGITRLD